MNKTSNEDQQKIWDSEHSKPQILPQMDSKDVSSGVTKFFEFLKESNAKISRGVEMGCGKGRNVIWFSTQQGVEEMNGFDFAHSAIREAKKRVQGSGVKALFKVQDATKPWPYENNYFDFAIDCFASTDIASKEGRDFAVSEFKRVLKPGAYFLIYTLSPDDEFHKEMIMKNPAEEKNAFYHDNGKFEKTFDEGELREIYKDFKIIKLERLDKTAKFFGKDYACHHFWMILQK